MAALLAFLRVSAPLESTVAFSPVLGSIRGLGDCSFWEVFWVLGFRVDSFLSVSFWALKPQFLQFVVFP